MCTYVVAPIKIRRRPKKQGMCKNDDFLNQAKAQIDGKVYCWQLPFGRWGIKVLYQTTTDGEKAMQDISVDLLWLTHVPRAHGNTEYDYLIIVNLDRPVGARRLGHCPKFAARFRFIGNALQQTQLRKWLFITHS